MHAFQEFDFYNNLNAFFKILFYSLTPKYEEENNTKAVSNQKKEKNSENKIIMNLDLYSLYQI